MSKFTKVITKIITKPYSLKPIVFALLVKDFETSETFPANTACPVQNFGLCEKNKKKSRTAFPVQNFGLYV